MFIRFIKEEIVRYFPEKIGSLEGKEMFLEESEDDYMEDNYFEKKYYESEHNLGFFG